MYFEIRLILPDPITNTMNAIHLILKYMLNSMCIYRYSGIDQTT